MPRVVPGPLGLLLLLAATAAAQTPDSSARSIMVRAIARRRAVLAGMQQVRYRAFVKMAARDLSEPEDSAQSVLLLTERRSSVFWEPGHHYQETIEARHPWRDGGIGHDLASVREIVRFSRNRIEIDAGVDPSLGGAATTRRVVTRNRNVTQYAIVSPLADDALDHYSFAVSETLAVAGRRVWRLRITPNTDDAPLFAGTVDVADSTCDVVAMDLGVTRAVQFPAVSDLRYAVRLEEVDDGRWMPAEVWLTGTLHRRISARWLPKSVAGVRLPEFPREVAFVQVAALSRYAFDTTARPSDLAEFRAVVRDQADDADSVTWSDPDAVPLTSAERAAWAARDSADRHPGFVPRLARDADDVQRAMLAGDAFHFNRVDGTYLGITPTWRATPALVVATKLGYGLGSEVWQYRAGAQLLVAPSRRLWVGAAYHDETMSWPALATAGYDPTASAFVGRGDPNNYYRERGFTASAGTKLVDFTSLELRYTDARQWTQDTVAGLGFQSTRSPPLPNPPIAEGRLRSIAATAVFDSRQFAHDRGSDYRLGRARWIRVSVSAEVSPHDVLASHFAFRRYSFQVDAQEQTAGLGTSTITLAGGVATRWTPPQRYFTVGFGRALLAADGVGFSTLERTQFAGNRALVALFRQDLGRRLFTASGLPLVRDLPATLSLHVGIFWTTLRDYTPAPADTLLHTAPRPYSETGFTLGNLTPSLSPFDLAVSCTWQLSSYPTHGFHFGIGVTGP